MPEREARRGDSSASYGSEEATKRSGIITATRRDLSLCRMACVYPPRRTFQVRLCRRALAVRQRVEIAGGDYAEIGSGEPGASPGGSTFRNFRTRPRL